MGKHPITHDTFVIKRNFKTSPERVFAAWADPVVKARWFWKQPDKFEFRVGGREIIRGSSPDGSWIFDAEYQEIIPNRRIVFSHTWDLNQTRVSSSLTTIELQPVSIGTKIIYTEQSVFYDGRDPVFRQNERGTMNMLDNLGYELGVY